MSGKKWLFLGGIVLALIGTLLFSDSLAFAKGTRIEFSGWTFDVGKQGYVQKAKIKGYKLIVQGNLVKKQGKKEKLIKNRKWTFYLNKKTKYYLVGLGEPDPMPKVSKKEFNNVLTQFGRGLPDGLCLCVIIKNGKIVKVTLGV